MVLMVLLQRVHPTGKILKVNSIDFDSRMSESVYKRMMFPLLDAVLHIVLECGVDNFEVKTRYASVLTHTTSCIHQRSNGPNQIVRIATAMIIDRVTCVECHSQTMNDVVILV